MADTVYILKGRESSQFYVLGVYSTRERAERASEDYDRSASGKNTSRYTITEVTMDGEARRQ